MVIFLEVDLPADVGCDEELPGREVLVEFEVSGFANAFAGVSGPVVRIKSEKSRREGSSLAVASRATTPGERGPGDFVIGFG